MLQRKLKIVLAVVVFGGAGAVVSACVAGTESESVEPGSGGERVGEAKERMISQMSLGVVPDSNNSEVSATALGRRFQ